MGMYDTVKAPCPKCGHKEDFQSKSGPCTLRTYELMDAPARVLMDVHTETCSKCGTAFRMAFQLLVVGQHTVEVKPGGDEGDDN